MRRLSNRLLRKYGLGGLSSITSKGSQLDALSPLTQKNYDPNFLQQSEYTQKLQNFNSQVDSVQAKAENAAIASGNPYAMAAGAIVKAGRIAGRGLEKASTNKFGETNGAVGFVGNTIGKEINPIGTIAGGFHNLGNDHLSTGQKILGFTPIGAVLNQNKLAKIEKEKYVENIGKGNAGVGYERYRQALANGFDPHGNEYVENYKMGGKLYQKLAVGGQLKPLSEENTEVEGRSHEEGGVKFPEQGVELEGGETVNNNFVFSKELGFAQKHKPIAKAIGKIEKKPETRFTRNSLNRLREREEQLKVEQEQTKKQLGIPNELDKFGGGGEMKFEPQEIDKLNELKTNDPEGYRQTVWNMMGYTPKKYPYGSDGWKEQEDKFNKGVELINSGMRYTEKNGGRGYTNVNKLYNKMGFGGFDSLVPNYSTNTPYKVPYAPLAPKDAQVGTAFQVSRPPMQKVGITTPTTQANTTQPVKGQSLRSILNNDIIPYSDNILNYALNRQRANTPIPDQKTTTYLDPVKYDYSAQKAEADTQRRAFNKSIDANNLNVGVANSNKGIGLFQTIRAKNLINQEETNANAGEKARVSTINKEIESNNNAITLSNKMRKIQAKDDIRREDSMNMANFVEKQGVYNRDKKLEDLVKDQTNVNLAAMDVRTAYPFLSSNPALAKKYGIDLNSLKAEYEKSLARDQKYKTGKFGGKVFSKLKEYR